MFSKLQFDIENIYLSCMFILVWRKNLMHVYALYTQFLKDPC